jgi:hypothetical protein
MLVQFVQINKLFTNAYFVIVEGFPVHLELHNDSWEIYSVSTKRKAH